jgi:NADH-quinone oxidoreductase subunit L
MEHMHTVKDPQDIRTMGGLGKYMPSTSKTFWISTLAISGIPFFSGFFSKDEILSSLFFNGYEHSIYFVVWGVATFTAILTAFYMTRVTYLTFNGQERFPHEKHPHESPAIMTTPLWVLAGLATVGGLLGIPALIGHAIHVPHVLNDLWLSAEGGLQGLIHNNPHMIESMEAHHAMEYFLLPFSAILAIGAVLLTRNFYRQYDLAGDEKVQGFFGKMYGYMRNKFYVDELYDAIIIRPFVWAGENMVLWFDREIIDGAVNGIATSVGSIGEVFRRLQTGLVRNYALAVSLGVIVILSYLIFG